MKNTGKLIHFMTLAVLISLALSACGSSTPEPTPTLGIEVIQTAAVGTFAAGLTQTASALPSNTPTATPSQTATITPMINTPVIVPTASCYGLVGVSDVSIPDNTPMAPGQAFVKTWLVKNTGTCAWEVGFKLVFTGGDAMGGTTLVLDEAVAPGAEVELSVAMTAPTQPGSVRGNWHMTTAGGAFFGDELFVIINVGGATLTPTKTTAPTETPTSTTSP